MRIADVLMEGGDDTKRKKDKSPSFQCLSPRLLRLCWLSKGKKQRSFVTKREKQESELRIWSSDGEDQQSSPTLILRQESRLDDVPERHQKVDCANLAVGLGLFYLIGASKNELSKMIELRREMEVLVHNARDEFQTQTKEKLYEPSEFTINQAFSTIDGHENLCLDGQFSFHNLSYGYPSETLTSYSCNQSLTRNPTSNGKCVEGIDQLEAELESELERLQVRLETSDYPRNQWLKEDLQNSSSEGSSSASFEEAVDIQEEDSSEHFGVCPHELERRLHELLESRQQEKIEELEAALQRANQRLFEREKEISWWKDTARIFSHHVPKASRLSRLGQASYRVN